MADYCVIFVDDGEGQIRLAARAHRDPEKEPLLDIVAERYRHSPENPHSLVNRALHQGPLLIEAVAIDTAEKITADAELLDVFVRLGPRSTLALPLAARGQVLGVLCMMTAESGRTYGKGDLEVGLELARRAALAVDNARLYREAREANASKDHFLAVLSHELRTPLTPVLAVVSSLEAESRIPEGLRGEMEMIRRNVELEARLIDDLLDLTRIARGKLELNREAGDARRVLEHAVQICCEQAVAEGRLRLEIELRAEDHRVWGDSSRLTQVLWNLLNNAVKFTPAGGEIRVSSWNEESGEVGRGEAGEGRRALRLLAIEVADTGIGIEPEMLPRIFNAFEQGNRSVTRRFGGIGLGLAVSKAIVEMHGGTLGVASEGKGRGAAFTLRLPVTELPVQPVVPLPAPSPATKRPIQEQDGASLHILLVEDHEDTAAAMSDLLQVMGYRVTVAGTVGQALSTAEACSQGQPGDGQIDLVVSDIGLPDGTGFDLMSELSRRYGLRGIALSGYGMEEDIRRSRESGFEKHLTKPVNPQALQSVLRQVTAV
jgi:signal transduction histidine kinase/ActR/RegA family two-component response regulator